jgi:bifunctional UDP-N-acetylglucosamine pyrophosphorylase/glucosamine-1-phosphate N-acetyltransferase/UDP-N-acetylglucosamine pyrophosphorylase
MAGQDADRFHAPARRTVRTRLANSMSIPIKAIILAAGKGTRMNADLPKVLVRACGRPLVEYVLDAVWAAGVEEAIVVVGYQADRVRETLAERSGITFAVQAEQLGTGHAVMMCANPLQGFEGGILIVTGDSPLTQAGSLRHLIDLYRSDRPACILGTLSTDNPQGLGRIVRSTSGEFLGIVEEKDATAEQKAIREVNMSTYLFDAPALWSSLRRIGNNNQQREYYITDCPGILKSDGADVRALPVLQACEALSVNTLDDLRVVEEEMRRRR